MSVETKLPTPPAITEFTTQYYYQVGDHTLLLEPDTRAEVLMQATTAPLPFPPAWCQGLVAIRGELFPLVDMFQVLYGQASPAKTNVLLWIKPEQSPAIVIRCDSYPKAIKLTADSLVEHSTDPTLPSWVNGWITHNTQDFLVANHPLLIRKLMQATPT